MLKSLLKARQHSILRTFPPVAVVKILQFSFVMLLSFVVSEFGVLARDGALCSQLPQD
jgi:hypothetical protein